MERTKKRLPVVNRIYGDLMKTGTPTSTVCKALGITDRSFYNRMKNPDTLTAREIRILRKFCSEETCDMITR